MAIEETQIVSLNYELRVDGELVDSNTDKEPLVFMFGKGQIISGLEDGIKQMSVGEKGDVFVKASEAYGEYDEQAIEELPKEQFAGIELETGMSLYGQSESGETTQVVVKEIGDDSVLIDFNHPMAGKDLMFSVDIGDIRDATSDEIAAGSPAKSDDGCCSTNSGHGCGCH